MMAPEDRGARTTMEDGGFRGDGDVGVDDGLQGQRGGRRGSLGKGEQTRAGRHGRAAR